MDTGALDISQTHYVVEGVDEEGYLTGQLPIKIVDEKPDFQDMESRRRMEHSEDEISQTETGEIKIKYNPEKHILLEEAKTKNKNIKVGDELVATLEPKTEFGRIAAQTAKQVIIQRLREAEREAIFSEFKGREGEIISGLVQRRDGALVFVDLGKTNGLLPPLEQVSNENYRMGQRYRFMILKVEENPRGPVVILSRAHPGVVAGLFRVEVPEIDSGTVEIKAVSREAGSRTKIAVSSKEEGIDPIGSLVGQKGVRVQTVINDLGGEKIDVIMWSEKINDFIANSFSPAKVLDVKILDDIRKHALVEVSDDQFSLAIGKKGQNVRLAAKLTGWKIDVRSPQEAFKVEETVNEKQDGSDVQ